MRRHGSYYGPSRAAWFIAAWLLLLTFGCGYGCSRFASRHDRATAAMVREVAQAGASVEVAP